MFPLRLGRPPPSVLIQGAALEIEALFGSESHIRFPLRPGNTGGWHRCPQLLVEGPRRAAAEVLVHRVHSCRAQLIAAAGLLLLVPPAAPDIIGPAGIACGPGEEGRTLPGPSHRTLSSLPRSPSAFHRVVRWPGSSSPPRTTRAVWTVTTCTPWSAPCAASSTAPHAYWTATTSSARAACVAGHTTTASAAPSVGKV